MKILIINGPNLHTLGKRQPEHYGYMSFDDYYEVLKKKYKKVEFGFYHSNREGDILDAIHKADGVYDGIILNAGAYTHTSIAISDAIQSVDIPVIEVHISNIYAREQYRHTSFLAPYCRGVIAGFGLMSYDLAVESYLNAGF